MLQYNGECVKLSRFCPIFCPKRVLKGAGEEGGDSVCGFEYHDGRHPTITYRPSLPIRSRPAAMSCCTVQLQPEQGQIPPPDHAPDALPILLADELAKAETHFPGRIEEGFGVLAGQPGQGVERGAVGRHGAA